MRHIAILIDGGYFLKRLPAFAQNDEQINVEFTQNQIQTLIFNHLKSISNHVESAKIWQSLYRSFYYDSAPYLKRGHQPISKLAIDYSKTEEAKLRLELFEELRRMPNMAVRLGELQKGDWQLKPAVLKSLLKRERNFVDLTDEDYQMEFRQKAVDMRIGMDMTAMVLKKQVDTIVLVTGDADFVPVAKLARREGARVVLDPLWRSVSDSLYEHIDELRSGLPNPRNE